MKLRRFISLLLTILMVTGISSVCLIADAKELESAQVGAGLGLGSYYNADYLEDKVYNGYDLGCTYTPAKTTWKVWSPEAKSVTLNLYATGSNLENGAENLGSYSLVLDSMTNVWTVSLDGDYKNVYYTYTVNTEKLGARETYDIYALACGVNGNRSMVVDLDSTDPEGWENDLHVFPDQMTDEAIWEIHIADLTSSDTSGVSDEYQGKFMGFVEGGLTYNGRRVGVDYLVEQGIKAVHIQCPFDFAYVDERSNDDYSWGYDPKNYNVPEGLYSTNPYDGNVRITEFKQLVQALHDRGISVIMGVVYNHFGGVNNSPFNCTVPGYYYRMNSSTQYNNCTACGNTLASDKQMYRNYMKQSLKYWVEEYHIDGFRFDLMAAHDWQVMNEIRDMFNGMYEGKGKGIIMYGEPWTGYGNPGITAANSCTINNASKLKENIGCFNGTTRDAIRSWFKSGVTTNTSTVKAGITSTTNSGLVPNKSVTYFDCHDDLTWWDNIVGSEYNSTDATYRAKLRSSMTYLFTSQGIPFMLAGTEFARTKYGNRNSYNAGETNAFDWKRIETYATEVAYVKGLREIRNAFSPFRSSSKITSPSYLSTGNNIIAYTLNNTKAGEWSKALVIVNNGAAGSVTLPSGTWKVVADGTKAGLTALRSASGSYAVSAYGSAILVQGETTATSATYETVTVNHVVGGKTIKSAESLYAVGDTWRAVPDNYTMFNHNVVSVESNAGTKLGNTYYGTVEAGKDVVVTITYEAFNTDGYLTIKYVDEKGNSIADSVTYRMNNGEKYNIPFSNVSGYQLVSEKYPANFEGTFNTNAPDTISFVYKQVEADSIDVYYYNSNNWSSVGMYAYTDNEDKPLGAWATKAQRMTAVTDASELPEGETTDKWFKKSITDANCQLDYHITSCNVMFHNMGQGEQEPLNGEPGYVASGRIFIKSGKAMFDSTIVTSHIDAKTGDKIAEDVVTEFKFAQSGDRYEVTPIGSLGQPVAAYCTEGELNSGVISAVYLYNTDLSATPSVAPAFSGASLTLHDNLCINFKANESLFTEVGYENPYVIFELNGKEFTVSDYEVSGGKYVFDFADIAPNNMNDTVKATLYATFDGVEYVSETREYSVATYCYNMLNKYTTPEYAELQTLLVDLLNYGAMSQIYTNHNTDCLVSADLTDAQKAWGTVDAPTYESVQNLAYKTIENPTVQWKGGGLNLVDAVTMRFKISANSGSYENLVVKAETDDRIWTIPFEAFTETTGGYYVYFSGLNAGEMSETVYLTVYENDEAVSNTLSYSIESYAYSKQNSTDTNLVNLLEAMMKYGNAAFKYANPDYVEKEETTVPETTAPEEKTDTIYFVDGTAQGWIGASKGNIYLYDYSSNKVYSAAQQDTVTWKFEVPEGMDSIRFYLCESNFTLAAFMNSWTYSVPTRGTCDTYTATGDNAGSWSGGDDGPYTPPTDVERIVYFSNVNHWDTVYAYCWNNAGAKNAEWPGVPMTLVEEDNGFGQQVYSYTVPSCYNMIVFNDGVGHQCEEINLDNEVDNGFYLTGQIVNDKGHYGYDSYAR